MGDAGGGMAAHWAALYGGGNGGEGSGVTVSSPTSGVSGGSPTRQFTGIPAGPYGPAGAGAGGPVISFGAAGADYGGAMPVRPSPTPASVMSFDHLHNRQTAAASSLQSQLFRPQHQQQYGGMPGAGAGDMFLHGFESSPEDRLLLQSIQAAQMLPRPASANNTNGYNFG
ncbi:hypothetical protein E2562_031626 [Oryza meyeriana var. granulata]|uniref:Uncharacterized protein n=1 Tax=Oryza meyeriana var. granulata TaxID=110450 RepID=A0A6G1DA05_9ORYZ|nr:hypothetical protein E2562_031626 [Oryza meyeriana var. granulata]